MSACLDHPLALLQENQALRERVRTLEAAVAHAHTVGATTGLHRLPDGIAVGIWRQDRTGKLLEVNRAGAEMFGQTPEQMTGRTPTECCGAVLREDGTAFEAHDHPFAVVLSTGRPIEESVVGVRHRDGGVRWILANTTPLPGPRNPNVGSVITIFQEITRRHLEARRLAESEEQLRLALDGSEYGMWQWDAATNLITSTAQHQKLYALSTGTNACSFEQFEARIPAEDRPLVHRAWQRSATERIQFEVAHRVIWPDGQVRWLLSRGQPYFDPNGEPVRLLGTTIDFTTHRETKEALRASKEHQALILRSLPLASYTAEAALSRPTWVSENIELLSGFAPSRFVDEEAFWRSRVHPEDLPRTLLLLSGKRRLRGFAVEYRWLHANGQYRWFLDQAVAVRTADPRRTQLIGTALDITERKTAEAALRKSEANLSLAIAAADLGTWDWDITHDHLLFSPRSLEMLGLGPGVALTYELFLRTIHQEDRASTHLAVMRALEYQIEFAPEYRCRRPDGTIRWIAGRGRVFHDETGKAIRMTGTTQDITVRKQAEGELYHLNGELEQRVLARTTQLESANQELQAEMSARRVLEKEILEISEREQCRLGQDLHDGLGQELAGIALLCKVHADKLTTESHPERGTATALATVTAQTIETARGLAKGLYPVELKRYGLLIALEDLANQIHRRFHIRCEFRQTGPKPQFDRKAEIHLYRIAQESIGNAIKHGQADYVLLESTVQNDVDAIAITDNGCGFQAHREANRGMGLHLMDYRARLIGGTISIAHRPGGGCTVTCSVRRVKISAELSCPEGLTHEAL